MLKRNLTEMQNQHQLHIKKLEDKQQRLFTLIIQLTRQLEMATSKPKRKRNKAVKETLSLPVFPPLSVDTDQ